MHVYYKDVYAYLQLRTQFQSAAPPLYVYTEEVLGDEHVRVYVYV